jgi:hypothetical protein
MKYIKIDVDAECDQNLNHFWNNSHQNSFKIDTKTFPEKLQKQ